MNETKASTTDKTFLFESKYPGLHLHLEEVMVKRGRNEIPTLRSVQFIAGLTEEGKKPSGYFTTTDPKLAQELREYPGFGRDFKEIPGKK